MKAFISVSAVLIIFAGAVTGRPLPDPELEKIGAIATQNCHESNDTRQIAAVTELENNEFAISHNLQYVILDTMNMANVTLELLRPHVIPMPDNTSHQFCALYSLNVSQPNISGLSDKKNSLLKSLGLISSYGHYLNTHENVTIFYPNITSNMKNLSGQINKIVAILSELLPTVTCSTIRTYIFNGGSGNLQTSQKPADITLTTYCVVELVFDNLKDTLAIL